MQDWPLLVSKLIEHAETCHGDREIVTLTVEGGTQRSSWRDVAIRARRVAQLLQRLGIRAGDRVATLAWNTHRHIECWYGISGLGAVAHTINPRLFADQIVYIANHAEDRVLFFDLSFVPLVEEIAPRLKTVEHFVVLTDRAHMPSSQLDLWCYEELIGNEDGMFSWPELDEAAAAGLCYTSGTTGNPKGVLYSHRSSVLHAIAAMSPDSLGITGNQTVLPVVPMYHANAWSVPYAAAAAGSKIVLAGPHFDAPTLARLIRDEGVTLTLAVPTIWSAMLQHLEVSGETLGALERVVIGGSACPRSMIEAFQDRHNVTVVHAWGMTEMSPVGTVGTLTAGAAALPRDEQAALQCKQGRAPFGVELKIVDDGGRALPRDGEAAGHLLVRGPWIARSYFNEEATALTADGWFDTGDIATIDAAGYMQVVDRSKDVIKSGGEWISSIDLENAAVGCPGVAQAAVIGMPHPKWGERPALIVVRELYSSVTAEDILAFLRGAVAKWWLPETISFVSALPLTATGKINKRVLREQFAASLPEPREAEPS